MEARQRSIDVALDKRIQMPRNKPLVVAPLGDLQWNGDPDELAYDHLERHIAEAMSLDAWFVGMGDYIDFTSPSNREAINAAKTYDGAKSGIEKLANDLNHDLYDRLLKPTKGRWLGMAEGHHFWQFRAGDTTDMRLCEMLKTDHLGTQFLYGLHFRLTGGIGGDVWIHGQHGQGSGTEGALLNRLKTLAGDWEHVDIHLMGHWTKKLHGAIPKLRPVVYGGKIHLRSRDVHLVGTGGWTKGLILGRKEGRVPRGSYVEKASMRPVSLGAPFIKILPGITPGKANGSVWMPEIRVEA